MRIFLIALLASVALSASAQKKPAAPVKQKTQKTASPIIQAGTVLIYSIGEVGTLAIRIKSTTPFSYDYAIMAEEYKNGSYGHSTSFLKSGKRMKTPYNYKDLDYIDDEYLTILMPKDMLAAFKAGRASELAIDGEEISFSDASGFDFKFNLHPKYFESDTNYTSRIEFVHGVKREFKAYSASSTEDATIEIWSHPSWPLLLYLSTPDGLEIRLEAIL